MPRSIVTAAVPVLVVALAWLRQESPARGWEVLVVAGLALVPALGSRLRWRLALAAGGAFAVAWLGMDAEPWGLVPGAPGEWFGPVGHAFQTGLGDYYEVVLPFDPVERWEMHGLLLLAAYATGVAITLLVASGRNVAAILVLVAGVAWPAVPVEGRGALALGAMALVAALWLLIVPRIHGRSAALAGGLAVVAVSCVATGVASTSALARGPVLDWKSWDFYDTRGGQVSVGYVWDANYAGIDFPKRRTTLLRIEAPRRALYWRASTLDTFASARWIENLFPVSIGEPRVMEPDPLLPAAARNPANWTNQRVEVVGLADAHLIGAATPVAVSSRSVDRVFHLSGGVLQATGGLDRGDRYVISSYVPRPSPASLLRSRPRYPKEAVRYLALESAELPAFGVPGRASAVDAIFADSLKTAVHPYQPIWTTARRIARRASSPYAATLAVERWLRAGGGFAYDQHPPPPAAGHPLVDFVTTGRRGYCQHFAGAMAMMLRFLGIPARVAVGFTSGRYSDGAWIVTDHEAHAWVEAWFEGFGWLPFDPTPGRGRFTAEYTIASDSAEAAALLQGGDIGDLLSAVTPIQPVDPTPTGEPESGSGTPLIPLALLAALVVAVALGLSKVALRRLRYRTSDPRRIAGATRAELVSWLRDQRIRVESSASYAVVVTAAESGLGVDGASYLRAATAARFGPPTTAGAAARDARRELRVLVDAMRVRLHRRDRLRGFLLPGFLRRSGGASDE